MSILKMQSVEWRHYSWITSGTEVTERIGRGLNWDPNTACSRKEWRKYVNESEWPASGLEVGPPTWNTGMLTNRSPQLLSCLQQNDPYKGRKVLGSTPERRSKCAGHLWPLLYSLVGILDGGGFTFFNFSWTKVKFCNLHPEFCRLHQEFNFWLSEQY
jgi:hypothetical protein